MKMGGGRGLPLEEGGWKGCIYYVVRSIKRVAEIKTQRDADVKGVIP